MTDIFSLKKEFQSFGIKKGSVLLVHTSLKSLEDVTPRILAASLLLALSDSGTLVVPSLSYKHANREHPFFDYHSTPSNIGAFPEYFRTSNIETSQSGVLRSLCPTHSCCAIGAKAERITSGHILDNTPCGPNSPFRRVYEEDGYILFIGCGMRPNTSMHAVEELSVPDYLYGNDIEYTITDKDGKSFSHICREHNFKGVSQRYERAQELLKGDEIIDGIVHNSHCQLVRAAALWEKADKQYRKDPHYFIDID